MPANGNLLLRAALIFLFVCAISALSSSQNGTATSASKPLGLPGAPNSADLTKGRMQEATASFQRGNYAVALAGFQEITAADPSNIVAHNLAGNCALRLKDYGVAVASFKKALELQPGESHNEAGLIEAYVRAGMSKERDAELERLVLLKNEGRLPANFHFLYEVFSAGNSRVEVTKFYPDLSSGYHFRYWFDEVDAGGKQLRRIALESDDVDQSSFAKEHPQEAAAGQRRFSLDGYAQLSHTLYHFYDGEPTYAQVRDEVMGSFSGKLKPSTSTTFNTGAPVAGQATPSAPPK
jgi:tetratricopeptide (TPR) repeat protein